MQRTVLSDRLHPGRAGFIPGLLVGYAVSTKPTGSEYLTAANAQLQAVVTDEDAEFALIIPRARRILEQRYKIAIPLQTITARYVGPARHLVLPVTPVVGSVTCSVVEAGGDDDDASSITVRQFGRDLFRANRTMIAGAGAEITVTYKAGYATADDVPEDIMQAWATLATDLFDNRSSQVIGKTVSELPTSVLNLMSPWAPGERW